MGRFSGEKCDNRGIPDPKETTDTILRDILDVKLKMKDPREDLVSAMNSLWHSAKGWVQKTFQMNTNAYSLGHSKPFMIELSQERAKGWSSRISKGTDFT